MRLLRRIVIASLLCAALLVALPGCAPAVQVDGDSPACVGTSVSAGSDLTETSQWAEVRLTFGAPLAAEGAVADDLEVLVNGKAPDSRTVQVDARVDGTDVVVRLTPTAKAANGGSVYFALYDGQVSVASRRDDGALPHVKAANGSSTAVLGEARVFTVPTGVQVGDVVREGSSVTFAITDFAQLRCCTWFGFDEELPLVKLHNHGFYRDTPTTVAERLAATVNANYSDAYVATSDGPNVTVTARDRSHSALVVRLVEGPDVDLSADPSADPDSTNEEA